MCGMMTAFWLLLGRCHEDCCGAAPTSSTCETVLPKTRQATPERGASHKPCMNVASQKIDDARMLLC